MFESSFYDQVFRSTAGLLYTPYKYVQNSIEGDILSDNVFYIVIRWHIIESTQSRVVTY